MMKKRTCTLVFLVTAHCATSFAPSVSRSRNVRSLTVALGESLERSASLTVDTNEIPWDANQVQDGLATVVAGSTTSVPDALATDEPANAAAPVMDVMADMTTDANGAAASSVSSISTDAPLVSEEEYQRGLLTIGFCTLVFASMSPAMHAALGGSAAPPVLLLNAAVSVLALVGLVLTGPFLEKIVPKPSTLQQDAAPVKGTGASSNVFLDTTTKAGLELGLWKFLGTTANLYGLSLTTADHGAFLIQLTTLIVPVVQGIMGVPIPQRIQVSVALALGGVALFTQDHASGAVVPPNQALGDLLCVVAAVFYATYDLRLFSWGKLVTARDLITTKIGTQAFLSMMLLAGAGWTETVEFLNQPDAISPVLIALVLWSGLMVNSLVPFLQVGGQQAIGPTRSQTIYASQPLWAANMSFFFLGETIGLPGAVGGTSFLVALFLAATAEAPDPDCGKQNCEV